MELVPIEIVHRRNGTLFRMRSAARTFPVVDLFSGPGGLAEGFSEFTSQSGLGYRIALSVEKDKSAYRTLLLRAFLRKFENGFPSEYYEFLNGCGTEEPDWATLYPSHWKAACDETKCLALGASSAREVINERIARIRDQHEGRSVLLGGPPCQAYSVIGRSRNAGNSKYKPEKDGRHLLYREYARVLKDLQPVAAIMENVRGMLSAKRNGVPIFPEVMRSLRCAGGIDSYRLFALTPAQCSGPWVEGARPEDYLVRAEEHGVPQARHRVIIVCLRRDVADLLSEDHLPRLEGASATVTVREVIGAMPMLRSRLSRCDDTSEWLKAMRAACELIDANPPEMSASEQTRFQGALNRALETAGRSEVPFRDVGGNTALPETLCSDLRDWIYDDRIEKLPNNETRGHLPSDLARYLFSAAFAEAFGRSPRTFEFPEALIADHKNWDTGKFADRFRVQLWDRPSCTVTSHISKDGHYFIHPDSSQCRSLTVREAARLQTFPDNYFFHGPRTQQYVQVGNAVPPFLAYQIAGVLSDVLERHDRRESRRDDRNSALSGQRSVAEPDQLELAAVATA